MQNNTITENEPTLIKSTEVLQLLPWLKYHTLYRGGAGTDKLTRYPHGLFSKEEVLKFKENIIASGRRRSDKLRQTRKVQKELI